MGFEFRARGEERTAVVSRGVSTLSFHHLRSKDALGGENGQPPRKMPSEAIGISLAFLLSSGQAPKPRASLRSRVTAQHYSQICAFEKCQETTLTPSRLDLSEINNFDAAWRTLYGLQTDVFCSAGLILPDKAGRQLTIGGWFGESNFGVRLYTPDGSAGVPGVEEWVEDPGTLSLQVPRWYPSALTMANGSILIVGGEIASNAAEQPTLELLPATGVPNPVPNTVSGYSNTTVYLDFLDRTAPFNLYPFICVLPTGGIFIAYYNEARILDEVTFATTRTLPNMPGSVNNPLAGRTYQLEGTMVLLPQYAPYTDHLQVLICGGSTAVGDDGDPIDNCISTAPEDSNPTWTIERMVSAVLSFLSSHILDSLTPFPSLPDVSCPAWPVSLTVPT
jgi:hypothetical protein